MTNGRLLVGQLPQRYNTLKEECYMTIFAKSIARRTQPQRTPPLPALENGDHLDQKTFHARYEAMPEDTRAELIGGIVYMSSPLKRPHGRTHIKLCQWLSQYDDAMPGTESFDNTTAILGEDSEPQPDGSLLIAPSHGGQTREEDEYIVGAPELAAEVAASTDAIDLHGKLRDYEKQGVKEYVVVVLSEQRVAWFVSRRGRFEPLPLGPDGIYRSEVFPGLWLDPEALLRHDGKRVRKVLNRGLATPEHAAFVAELATRKTALLRKKNGKKRAGPR